MYGVNANDIKHWNQEITKKLDLNTSESNKLLETRQSLERMIKELNGPLHIAQEKLFGRESREGMGFACDSGEQKLLREFEAIQSYQQKLRKQLDNINTELACAKTAKFELERDLRRSGQAYAVDTQQQHNSTAQVATNSGEIAFHSGNEKVDPTEKNNGGKHKSMRKQSRDFLRSSKHHETCGLPSLPEDTYRSHIEKFVSKETLNREKCIVEEHDHWKKNVTGLKVKRERNFNNFTRTVFECPIELLEKPEEFKSFKTNVKRKREPLVKKFKPITEEFINTVQLRKNTIVPNILNSALTSSVGMEFAQQQVLDRNIAEHKAFQEKSISVASSVSSEPRKSKEINADPNDKKILPEFNKITHDVYRKRVRRPNADELFSNPHSLYKVPQIAIVSPQRSKKAAETNSVRQDEYSQYSDMHSGTGSSSTQSRELTAALGNGIYNGLSSSEMYRFHVISDPEEEEEERGVERVDTEVVTLVDLE